MAEVEVAFLFEMVVVNRSMDMIVHWEDPDSFCDLPRKFQKSCISLTPKHHLFFNFTLGAGVRLARGDGPYYVFTVGVSIIGWRGPRSGTIVQMPR